MCTESCWSTIDSGSVPTSGSSPAARARPRQQRQAWLVGPGGECSLQILPVSCPQLLPVLDHVAAECLQLLIRQPHADASQVGCPRRQPGKLSSLHSTADSGLNAPRQQHSSAAVSRPEIASQHPPPTHLVAQLASSNALDVLAHQQQEALQGCRRGQVGRPHPEALLQVQANKRKWKVNRRSPSRALVDGSPSRALCFQSLCRGRQLT